MDTDMRKIKDKSVKNSGTAVQKQPKGISDLATNRTKPQPAKASKPSSRVVAQPTLQSNNVKGAMSYLSEYVTWHDR
jgi:hypothetical protein